ncbi:MAG: DUF6922 domain-containing protein [Bacteroidales bacterium]
MEKPKNIINKLRPQYFWDVDINLLEPIKSKRLLVERVLALGTSKEIKMLVKFLGKNEFVNIVKSLNYIDPKTVNFASFYFEIPLESFKCYTRKQSSHQRWSS